MKIEHLGGYSRDRKAPSSHILLSLIKSENLIDLWALKIKFRSRKQKCIIILSTRLHASH